MKVYNKEKTELLETYDLSLGRLVDDVIEVVIPEVKEVKERFHYEIIKEYPNGGKEVKKVIDLEGVKGSPEYTKVEKIKVYIPYTEVELKNFKEDRLRFRRKTLLMAFDKWEKAVLRGREKDDPLIMAWFNLILDLSEPAFKAENIPERIKYYL